MIYLNGEKIEPTIFPDKTSQVWKLKQQFEERNEITWDFEYEGEIMHVAQMAALVRSSGKICSLHVPFLPYGRQDKIISNESAFALTVFSEFINAMNFNRITTVDAHSELFTKLTGAFSLSPEDNILKAIEACKAEVIGLPDHGAYLRYRFPQYSNVVGAKNRDQSTGKLEYTGIVGADGVQGKRVLIVDDICDGGMTFILFTKILYDFGAKDVCLWTTHGIYSKGTSVLKDAGISRIFNLKGEVQ